MAVRSLSLSTAFRWIGYTLHFPDWLTVFLAQGIGGGINTVLPLVPQIGMMYLFLSFLEDSGYMARAAFVMDRLMQALGSSRVNFVPLIVGFAVTCRRVWVRVRWMRLANV